MNLSLQFSVPSIYRSGKLELTAGSSRAVSVQMLQGLYSQLATLQRGNAFGGSTSGG